MGPKQVVNENEGHVCSSRKEPKKVTQTVTHTASRGKQGQTLQNNSLKEEYIYIYIYVCIYRSLSVALNLSERALVSDLIFPFSRG